MEAVHRSILAQALMISGASLVLLMTGAGEGRADGEFSQGANGVDAVDGDPDNPTAYGIPATSGDSATATAGSLQPVTDPANSASATGGNGGIGGNDSNNASGGSGGEATATAATNVILGPAEADATAIGGFGGCACYTNPGIEGLGGSGGSAYASSTAVTAGSGDVSSSANAAGGSAGGGGQTGFAGSADAIAAATAAGGGKAVATAVATSGYAPSSFPAPPNADAESNAKTVNGAMATAQSIAIPGGGGPGFDFEASSTATTSFAGGNVESTTTAPGGFLTATSASTNAIAQGGSGQALVNPGQDAYAFSTGLPDKAYATTLIDSASNVASALLGAAGRASGAGILGANFAPDSFSSSTYSASSTYDFDFAYRGDLVLGLIDDQVSGFADGQGFQSMEFTISANGEGFSETFLSLAQAESFFHDNVINLGSYFGPSIGVTLSYTLTADGAGGFGFDYAFGGAVPEPSTWAMMLVGFAGLGFMGWRGSRKTAAHAA